MGERREMHSGELHNLCSSLQKYLDVSNIADSYQVVLCLCTPTESYWNLHCAATLCPYEYNPISLMHAGTEMRCLVTPEDKLTN